MRWHTLYNKNIVLNILSNIFGEQIEDYVQNCVIRLENNILEKYFNYEEKLNEESYIQENLNQIEEEKKEFIEIID